MWLMSGSAWTEANVSQKWMGGVTRTGVLVARVCRRWCHIYRQRSPSEYNGSCPDVRDIPLGLWWNNTLSSMPHLTPSSPPQHELSSSHLVHLNQPLIPSPILEKSRGGLAREEEI